MSNVGNYGLIILTNHSKNPSLVLKFIFHTSVDSIGIWWYPDLRLRLVNNLVPFKVDESSYPRKRASILYQNFVESPIVDAHAPSPMFLWNEDDSNSTRRGVGSDVTFVDQILNLFVNIFILNNGSSVNKCVR